MTPASALYVIVALTTLVWLAEARTLLYDAETDAEDEEYGEPRRRRSEVEAAAPLVGLGVLSDMQQFFNNLRSNLDTLESLPTEERDALLGRTPPQLEKDQYFRPAATAAYLHAMRNQRPSFKIRNFVESPEPVNLRGTNRYDPSLLWTGLGRRRR